MPLFVLNTQTANNIDPLIEFGHPDANGRPTFSRRDDAIELAYRPEEVARIHVLPLKEQKLGKPPVPNVIFIAVRQIDPRETLGWCVEHFMSLDRNIADELGLDMDRFRKVLAEVQKGSVKDKNDFALKVLFAFARFQPDAAALLRGLVLPDKAVAEVDAFVRAHLIPT
jgi:hypothetical protein